MSRLKKNITYNLLGQISLLVISFISVKYIYQSLGADALGIIYFTIMFNSLLSATLGLGIGPMLIREVATHIEDDEKYVHKLVQTASFIFWCMFFCLSIIVYFLAPIIVSLWINLESMSKDTATYALRVLGVASLISFPQSVYTNLFNGLQRMEYPNAIQVIVMLLQQVGIIIILTLDGDLMEIIHWIAGCYGILIVCYLITTTRFIPINALIPRLYPSIIRGNVRFSLNMGIISILAFLHTQVDKIIISKFLPISTLGYYNIAYNVTSKITFLAGPISHAAYPAFCELFKSGAHNQILTQYNKLQDMVCYISIPILAFVIFYNQIFFSYLFDKNIAEMLLVPVVFLCMGSFLQIAFHVPYNLILALGKANIVVKVSSLNLLISVPTAVISIHFWGLAGAGIAFLLSRLFNSIVLIPNFSKDCLNLSPIAWYLHIMKILFSFIMSYAIVWLILYLNDIQSVYNITIGFLIASTLFISSAWLLIGEEFKSSLTSLRTRISPFID